MVLVLVNCHRICFLHEIQQNQNVLNISKVIDIYIYICITGQNVLLFTDYPLYLNGFFYTLCFYFEGLNGALICNVNDDASMGRSTSTTSLDFSRTNLHNLQGTRRVERLLPPMGFWNTYGVGKLFLSNEKNKLISSAFQVEDTDRWRNELVSLAAASGLATEKNEKKSNNRLLTADQQNASRSGARYSTRTGRFNEGTSKSRGRTGSKHATPFVDTFFNVSENERELWVNMIFFRLNSFLLSAIQMLQVLCQLLGTSDLKDVQSWLVSASHAGWFRLVLIDKFLKV